MFAGSQKVCGIRKKLSKEGSPTGVPKAKLSFFFFLFSFAGSYEGRSIGIRGSKQSQDPGHLMGCSISGNAAGISYLTHRELSQETVFTSSSRKIQVQSKNSYQDLHLPELRILVLLFICHQCRETLLLKAGSWGAEKQSWTWGSLVTNISPYASDKRSQVQLPHTSPAITVSALLNCQQ